MWTNPVLLPHYTSIIVNFGVYRTLRLLNGSLGIIKVLCVSLKVI